MYACMCGETGGQTEDKVSHPRQAMPREGGGKGGRHTMHVVGEEAMMDAHSRAWNGHT